MFRKRMTEVEAFYMQKMHEILGNPPITGVARQMTQVLPHVYLGGQPNAESMQTLKTHGITYVLNCGASSAQKGSPYGEHPIVYEQFLAVDDDNYDIGQHFNEAFTFLDKAKRKKGKVLVHCAMGINRSGVVCAAYIMKERGLKLLETLRMLKLKRDVFLTNPGFRYHLLKFAMDRGLVEPIKDLKADPKAKLVEEKPPENQENGLDEELEARMAYLATTFGTDNLARSRTVPSYSAPWRPPQAVEMPELNRPRYDVIEPNPPPLYRNMRPFGNERYVHDDYYRVPVIGPPVFSNPGFGNPHGPGFRPMENREIMPLLRHKPITPFYGSRSSRALSLGFGRPHYRHPDLMSTRAYLH